MAQALVMSTSQACSNDRESEATDRRDDPGNSTCSEMDDSSHRSNRIHGSKRPCEKEWRVSCDNLCHTVGLIPPSGYCPEEAECVTLEEAVSIVSEPRLIAQATPPFCVIFANKAFLQFAELVTQGAVIGKPIESIIRVCQDIVPSSSGGGKNVSLKSELQISNNKECTIRVIPVSNCAKRRKISATCSSGRSAYHSENQNNGNSKRSRYSYASEERISHLLVPVSARDDHEMPTIGNSNDQPMTITVIESNYDSVPPKDDSAFGTVG